MDRSEELAQEYLKRLGFELVPKPNGETVFPDFEIDNKIAIEVRRLNKNYFQFEAAKGLRETSQPLSDSVSSIFEKFIKHNPKQNFWVSLTIKRPVGDLGSIRKELKKALEGLIEKEAIQTDIVVVSQNVALKLSPKSKIEGQVFHLGAINDLDSGGYVIPDLIENLNYCIEEKTDKSKKSPKSYEKFWLILVDEISYGRLSDHDKAYVVENVKIPPVWERIITLNTLTGEEILKIERK